MNALELADELMKFYNLEENTGPIQIFDLSATMLRQQQAEIQAALELVKKFQAERSELKAKIDDMAGDIMTLENQIGTMTGYGHN
jgi:predicted RNase H-like nuclease (RuvC/YqgF family)